MKIERDKEFKPFKIVIETQLEADMFEDVIVSAKVYQKDTAQFTKEEFNVFVSKLYNLLP